ncbi:hypothetical protein DV711_14805 [Motiliproteus coralliicola]|uniref:Uncharacterized protein n=1 Tax=Motiliproteus coralliicola TaxID=2283196 RepID=A0A369WDW1_9GAMM|nr:YheV family putative zinc ribbon protein [Motiliproteus coralliicola]RDE18884.1 hypothetical protein DV711_14805 [Motiliproteus coralliicola]
MTKPIKRFVAGAVCPRCGEMDKLRTWRDEVQEHRECIQCGYTDAMRLDGLSGPEEMETRVNQPRTAEPQLNSDEQVINFVPMPSKNKH